jgi:hypothetical protein
MKELKKKVVCVKCTRLKYNCNLMRKKLSVTSRKSLKASEENRSLPKYSQSAMLFSATYNLKTIDVVRLDSLAFNLAARLPMSRNFIIKFKFDLSDYRVLRKCG